MLTSIQSDDSQQRRDDDEIRLVENTNGLYMNYYKRSCVFTICISVHVRSGDPIIRHYNVTQYYKIK